jgi:peptidoglycan biosynthesis protein MviN/MurJ (putative lipid II flippase)
MLLPVLRFFQRYALIFALLAGSYVRHWVLPHGDPWWLRLGITLAAAGAVYFLLYKDGVTANRRGDAARLRVIEIIGFSVLYWLAILLALLVIWAFAGDSPADWLPFGQKIDWPTALAIAALVLAAIVYAMGLRAAIRKRRRHSFLN